MGELSWMDLDIGTRGDRVEIGARSQRHHPLPALLDPAITPARLEKLKKLVGGAVRESRPLDEATLAEAQAVYAAVFQGDLRDVANDLERASDGAPVLHRLMLRDPFLHAIPWEALCQPRTSEGFWGTSPRVSLARGVWSKDPWDPKEVKGAVKVLAIAPHGVDTSLKSLRAVLEDSIAAGEIEWLDPIAGPRAGERTLLDSISRSATPHILHFIGHGGVNGQGHPVLRLADNEDEECWYKAEALVQVLAAHLKADLRLVVLECCEGAKAGVLGSAAEMFVKGGADAAIAHLWPIKAKAAVDCSRALYRALTGVGTKVGDVGASLAEARRALIDGSAERFSPVLYLRGPGTVLFDFARRQVVRPTAGTDLAPALDKLLQGPFSLILGDDGEDRQVLRVNTEKYLRDAGDKADLARLALGALTQRLALRFGETSLEGRFQNALKGVTFEAPPLIEALAGLLSPGVHATLLWLPLLELALAKRQPNRTIQVIQPSLLNPQSLPEVYRLKAGERTWETGPNLLKEIAFTTDLVVLRLYGGYTPNQIYMRPLLTEDDQVRGLIGGEGLAPPKWAAELIAHLQGIPAKPALFAGLSVLEIRHRMLISWLYSGRPAPSGSMAVLGPASDSAEKDIWESGRGLPGNGRIETVQADPAALALSLERRGARRQAT